MKKYCLVFVMGLLFVAGGHSQNTTKIRKQLQKHYGVKTGISVIEVEEHFREMTDKEWHWKVYSRSVAMTYGGPAARDKNMYSDMVNYYRVVYRYGNRKMYAIFDFKSRFKYTYIKPNDHKKNAGISEAEVNAQQNLKEIKKKYEWAY